LAQALQGISLSRPWAAGTPKVAMGCGKSTAKPPGNEQKSAAKPHSKADAPKDPEKETAKRENKDYAEIMSFLAQVTLFRRLPRDHHPILAAACIPEEFKQGEEIIKQGESGDAFFLIRKGTASVSVVNSPGEPPQKVASLKTGDYFGENALLRDEPRTATITAEDRIQVLKITRDKFQELGLNEKLQFANRKAVGGGGNQKILTKEPSPKTESDRQLIIKALKGNENLQTMVALDDARIQNIMDVAWKEDVPTGTFIIKEGDMVADYFYIVGSGRFEISVSDGRGNAEDNTDMKPADSKHVQTVKAGGSFGELALLYLVPRAATVQAAEDSSVWVIDRRNFKQILMKASDQKLDEYVRNLNRVKILDTLLKDEKRAIAQALVEMHFSKDEVILQQGELGNTFYILYHGEVSVIKDGKEIQRLKTDKNKEQAHPFGERALLNNEPRAATVKVVSETAKALALDRESFSMLLGPLSDIIQRNGAESAAAPRKPMAGQMAPVPQRQGNRDRILKKDLMKIGLLGCGGFGAVELWEHRVTGETYAMKALSKGYIVKTGMQESVMNEKNILMMTNSNFIIKLFETFNGTQTLYFLMEPALGGELYATYSRKALHGSEKHCRYYTAGVVNAFEHCHERRVIYRDLKPENLLLTEQGHLKLTDMGLAKFCIGKTFTTCGTPDYFAPELIASTGHTNAVDWWMLGILIFELMSGHPPFESAYPMQIYAKVMKGISKVNFPAKCQGAVGEVIKALLKKEPSERLPMRPGGVKNLRDHKFYMEAPEFNWEQLNDGSLAAPYKPTVKNKKDIANFSARKEDLPPTLEYKNDGSNWDKDFAPLWKDAS